MLRDKSKAAQPEAPRHGLSLLRLLALVLGMVFVAGAERCPSFDRWSRTDEFVAQLRCGMSIADVEQVVARYRRLSMRQIEGSSEGWNLVAEKAETNILMKLDGGGLRWVRVSWIDSIMHIAVLPEVDLCAPGTAVPPPGD